MALQPKSPSLGIVISQETFNDVVKENIIEFEMDPEEAKEETIKQFEAQGINLANIIKDLDVNPKTGRPLINEAIENLKTIVEQDNKDPQVLISHLKEVDSECQKSIAHRVLAAKKDCHNLVFKAVGQYIESYDDPDVSVDVLINCLKVLNSMYNKQPDLLDANALSIAKRLLTLYSHNEVIVCLVLQWLQKCCIMHEINRQNVMSVGIVQHLKQFVDKKNGKVLKDVLAVYRYLVLDDDIRVEFGCAHEHARVIASEVIIDLTNLLGQFEDSNLLADLLLTIGTLTVRQEFCTTVDEVGGTKLVLQVMSTNIDSVRINREALKLLRALAGHDAVKSNIIQHGVAPILKELLNTHANNENVVSAALACISTLTLRVKDNSKVIFDTGISEAVVEAMRMHPNNKIVQRNGAWAIRNMVSRSREQCDTWLSHGIEDLLNTAMQEHPSVAQDIKAALRDLGCKVELKEEWTGTAEKKILNSNFS